MHFLDRLVDLSLKSRLPLILFIVAVTAGVVALQLTPREEEPQIVVPMIDVQVQVPNHRAQQIERQVTNHLEKLLKQIPGVEHVYSVTTDGQLNVTLRFYVGENREDALLNTYNKLYSNQDKIPTIVSKWMVNPVEVDDIAILMLGLYSTQPSIYSDFELRRFAEELSILTQRVEDTSAITITGGRHRELSIELDLQALQARNTGIQDVLHAIDVSNVLSRTGSIVNGDSFVVVEVGDNLISVDAFRQLPVNIVNGIPVLLGEVASIDDAPSEPVNYQWLDLKGGNQSLPMVTINVAKKRRSNAVRVANEVLEAVYAAQQQILPEEVKLVVLRNYGQTANDKVNNLTSSLLIAIITVVVFIGIFLGFRQAVVIGLTVPVCYGMTLMLDLIFGYSINRVTLFALILSLGLLVDDPITGVDNISRFLANKKDSLHKSITTAMSEIRPALVMSTITIVLAFVPLAFITGMMGPYMAPMSFNVPVAVIMSTLIAFTVTPWLAKLLLKPDTEVNNSEANINEQDVGRYGRLLGFILASDKRVKLVLWSTLVLFILACLLPLLRAVPLKLLPYDNKSEIQVLVDLPENTSLEKTASLLKSISDTTQSLPEVREVAAYTGIPSTIDFNGMVRQYYQRVTPNLAELRVTLVDKMHRIHQSHAVVLRLREALARYNKEDISVKVIEVPPGPPVLSTLVAEVRRAPFVSEQTHQQAAKILAQRLKQEAHVVEVDTSIQHPADIKRFVVDKTKAALSGVSTQDVASTVKVVSGGLNAGTFVYQADAQPIQINVKTPFGIRNQIPYINNTPIKGSSGFGLIQSELGTEQAPQPIVSLAEVGQWAEEQVSQPILHKDLEPVIYVTAEINGRTPAEVIADITSDFEQASYQAGVWQNRTFLNSGSGIGWSLPKGTSFTFSGEGEWKITIDVFRDMGIAFAFALVAIFVVLRFQTQSVSLSLIIMSSIPLTFIGIMPGFWLLNQFGEREIAGAPEPVLFTATAMIGMIALAGIVIRSALILIEFITNLEKQGVEIKQALVKAGTVRARPVLLTAGTTLLGNLIITLDPVFSGLALAIIFGIVASTLFTLFVVPAVYYLVFRNVSHKAG